MYRLWSEWDIGEGNKIFATAEAGMRWLDDNLHVNELACEENKSVSDWIAGCFDEGYFSWEKLEIVQ